MFTLLSTLMWVVLNVFLFCERFIIIPGVFILPELYGGSESVEKIDATTYIHYLISLDSMTIKVQTGKMGLCLQGLKKKLQSEIHVQDIVP